MRTISPTCIAFIQQFEGFRSEPYQDTAGHWTIGYGHTQGVDGDTLPISQTQALSWLMQDAAQAGSIVERLIYVPLNDNQFSALVSLVFNLGSVPLANTLGKKLNARDYPGAAQEFTRWVMSGGAQNLGLMRRRLAEKQLFLTPVENV